MIRGNGTSGVRNDIERRPFRPRYPSTDDHVHRMIRMLKAATVLRYYCEVLNSCAYQAGLIVAYSYSRRFSYLRDHSDRCHLRSLGGPNST